MGATLNIANAMSAYVLSDRATWLKSANKGDLAIVFQGDTALFNQYGVQMVNPERHPHVKVEDSQRFIDWLVSESGQTTINSFVLEGEQAFFANAGIE